MGRTLRATFEMPKNRVLCVDRISYANADRGDAQRAGRRIQRIGGEACATSNWVQELAREHGMNTRDLVRKLFDPDNEERVALQTEKVHHTMRLKHSLARRGAYWVVQQGLEAPTARVQDPIAFVKTTRSQAPIDGKVCDTAHLHDVHVLPDDEMRNHFVRRKGIATAAAYVALSDYPDDMPSSMYVAAANAEIQSWAEGYGYRPVKERTETDMFGEEIPVPFMTYAAGSVGEVRQAMAEHSPWLEAMKTQSSARFILSELFSW